MTRCTFCTKTDRAGNFAAVAEPVAPERPTVVEDLRDVVAGLGERIDLRCVITGVPEPDIRWYVSGMTYLGIEH